jgi:hypothetical protein
MIVDCHTHVWESIEQLGRGTGLWGTMGRGQLGHTRGAGVPPQASMAEHLRASEPVDKTFVLALKSAYLEADIPNDYVAGYVRKYPNDLIGFASVDPTRPREAIDELKRVHDELGMSGLSIWPAAQDFHPASTAAMRVHAEACRLGMPVIFHQSVQASPVSKMEFARPYLVDEVAREFPDLKIVISQLGYPWMDETIVLVGKHSNVFADISGLLHHPWQSYNALLTAYQAGVMDRLLFGSNFPFSTPAQCIEALYSINQFCHGTNLPTVPREQLRRIVECDALALLGLSDEDHATPKVLDSTLIQSED